MSITIDDLGGTSEVARLAGVAPPSVTAWRKRGIPPERCPAIERGLLGKFTCEQMCPQARWVRVPDAAWPHPAGRPLLDVVPSGQPTAGEGNDEQGGEAVHAGNVGASGSAGNLSLAEMSE